MRICSSRMMVIKQSLVFAVGVNLLGIGLSVIVIIPPLVASTIRESNVLVVTIYGLRLLKVDWSASR